MNMLTASKAYFEELVYPMLVSEFPEYINRIAVGLVGHGSECYGFDDEISTDHDYEPGVCLWLSSEDDRDIGFKLFRAYDKLPKSFAGISLENTSYIGASGHGVQTIEEFYSRYTGMPYISEEGYLSLVPKTNEQWLYIPDKYLAEAVNGEVFSDTLGEFTKVRNALKNMPKDVWLKKLGSAVFNMAQYGQYNYKRCMLHGEKSASVLYLCKFAEETAKAVFCINEEHAPYTKWLYKAMERLPVLGSIKYNIDILLQNPCSINENVAIIESICSEVVEVLKAKGLTDINDEYLESHSYRINERIKDGNLRNSPVML